MKKNEINVQVELNEVESAMELGFSAMNKAFGAVFTETRKFKQAIRVFDGMGSLRVPVSKTKTMRFDELLNMCGIEYKAGRVVQESVQKMWNIRTEDGYMAIYRNVPGYEAVEGDDKPRKVYTWSEEKKEHVGVSMVKVVAVEKWDARTILRGILQTAYRSRFEKMAADTLRAWDEFTGELYVFDKVQDKDGVNNKRKAIRKDKVVF